MTTSHSVRTPLHGLRRVVPSLLALLALGLENGAPAVDGTVFSVAVESLPTDYEFVIRDGATTTQGEEVFDLAYGASVGIRLDAPLGSRFITSAGLEVVVGGYASAQDDRYLTLLVRAVLGYRYRLREDLTIGVEGWLGGGGGDLHIAGINGAADVDVHGGVFEAGARLVADYACGAHWYLRGGLGLQYDDARLGGDGLEVDLRQAGPVALLGLGWSY